ncbi:hypothetical protein AAGG74_16045 [Bacillus mexicanus]|uniref:hypothetical protein n=1 Tax=Bacillus mexicanus TaxID=2834415 RepID=UPI003D1EB195
MTMSLEMIVNPKYNGKMYHLLNEEEQRIVDEKAPEEPEIIYEASRDWDIYNFFREQCDVIESDEGGTIMFINIDKIGNVIFELKEKIKGITGKMDVYDHENYGDDSEAYVWTKIFGAIKKYFKHNDMTQNYLIIQATW